MTIPTPDIEQILFGPSIDAKQLSAFAFDIHAYAVGEFKDINWLNTPGPIYTTYTDNCGTGQVAAINNVGGDADYHEFIFKQPFTRRELEETLTAAAVDPYGAYYFDGSACWNADNIMQWWQKSEERLNYILGLYEEELKLPMPPHVTSWKIGGKTYTGQLFGPPRPVPENYKYWLDFYQFGMKSYLEWYILKVEAAAVTLPAILFDWTKREELDKLYLSKIKNVN